MLFSKTQCDYSLHCILLFERLWMISTLEVRSKPSKALLNLRFPLQEIYKFRSGSTGVPSPTLLHIGSLIWNIASCSAMLQNEVALPTNYSGWPSDRFCGFLTSFQTPAICHVPRVSVNNRIHDYERCGCKLCSRCVLQAWYSTQKYSQMQPLPLLRRGPIETCKFKSNADGTCVSTCNRLQ